MNSLLDDVRKNVPNNTLLHSGPFTFSTPQQSWIYLGLFWEEKKLKNAFKRYSPNSKNNAFIYDIFGLSGKLSDSPMYKYFTDMEAGKYRSRKYIIPEIIKYFGLHQEGYLLLARLNDYTDLSIPEIANLMLECPDSFFIEQLNTVEEE